MAKWPATAHHHYSPMQSLSPMPAQCKAYHQCQPNAKHITNASPRQSLSPMPAQCKAYHQGQPNAKPITNAGPMQSLTPFLE